MNSVLHLIGLARKAGRLAVGEDPVGEAVKSREGKLLLVACDAAENTIRRAGHMAESGTAPCLTVPFTKAELGRAVGRTSAALVAVTDIGLANAVANRLAQLDEDQYGEAAERLALKAKRAAERQSELRAHEKNVRTGKYRPKPRRTPEDSSPQVEKSPPDRRPRNQNRSRPRRGSPTRSPHPYAHSRPVKKGKGSFRKRED